MGNITKVPNGPLIKKKGPYAGSTLRSGGPIKKAQVGTYQPMNPRTKFKTRSEDGNYKLKLKGDKLVERRTLKGFFSGAPRAQGKMDLNADNVKLLKSLRSITNSNDLPSSKDKGVLKNKGTSWDSIRPKYPKSEFKFAANKNGGPIKKAQGGKRVTRWMTDEEYKKETDSLSKNNRKIDPGFTISPKGSRKNTDPGFMKTPSDYDPNKKRKRVTSEDGMLQYLKNGNKIKKAKAGAMIKRADGSMSRRGLWDNIRANKGSGKKPTKQMLVQEKKIKAKSKK